MFQPRIWQLRIWLPLLFFGVLVWACSETESDPFGPEDPQTLEWQGGTAECPTCRLPTASERWKMMNAMNQWVCGDYQGAVAGVIDELEIDYYMYTDRGYHRPAHDQDHYVIAEFNFYDPAYSSEHAIAELLLHELGHHIAGGSEAMASLFAQDCHSGY